MVSETTECKAAMILTQLSVVHYYQFLPGCWHESDNSNFNWSDMWRLVVRIDFIWLVAHCWSQDCFRLQRQFVRSGISGKNLTVFIHNIGILLILALVKAFSYRDYLNPTCVFFFSSWRFLDICLRLDLLSGSSFWPVIQFSILYLCLVRIWSPKLARFRNVNLVCQLA